MANTLFEFYQQKGQALPPWQERAKLAQQYGIADYTGTAEQNTALLAKLQTTPSPGIVQVGPTPVSAAPIDLGVKTDQQQIAELKQKIANTLSQIETLKPQLEKAKAYEAGLGKTGGEIPTTVLEAPTPEVAERAGKITTLEEKAFAKPTKTYQEIYNQAFEDAGLKDLKTRIDAVDEKINKAKSDLVAAEQSITENAWLSESGRVGRIKTLYSLAEKTISNLLDQRNSLFQEYSTGVSQAQNVATRTLAETEAGRKLSLEELNYLQGLRKEKPEKPTIFGSEKVGYYTWEIDPKTNKYIQKKVIEPIKEKGTPQLKQNETGEWVWIYPDGTTSKTGIKGKVSEFGVPTAADKSKAKAWLYTQPDFTQDDLKRLETDEAFFYWALEQANLAY